jgi:hypothetical protein
VRIPGNAFSVFSRELLEAALDESVKPLMTRKGKSKKRTGFSVFGAAAEMAKTAC